jgi:hypothetical protein
VAHGPGQQEGGGSTLAGGFGAGIRNCG